jgi:hypothetical protein
MRSLCRVSLLGVLRRVQASLAPLAADVPSARPPLAIIGATGKTEPRTGHDAAMQGKRRFLSIRRLWRSGRASLSGGVRNLMTRRRLTTEEWVDQTYAGGIEKIRRTLTEKRATLPAGSAMRAYVERLLDLRDETLLDEIYSRVHANPTLVLKEASDNSIRAHD